jgi:hypothetical protein
MSDKSKEKPQPRQQGDKPDQNQKTSDTVHLSAEELRKISGGQMTTSPPPTSVGGGH